MRIDEDVYLIASGALHVDGARWRRASCEGNRVPGQNPAAAEFDLTDDAARLAWN
jgi:hypothetical protein